MEALKQQWQAREPKEQLIIVLALVLVMALALFWLAYRPIAAWNQDQQIQVERSTNILIEVNQLVAQLEARKANDGQPTTGNLVEIVDRTLRDHNIKMGGFTPNKKSGVARVNLNNVSYDALLQWFYDLEYKEQVQIVEASIVQTPTPGFLTVRMSLRK